MRTVYLNGAFVPEDEAKIPVLDRGFIFGDGVYEVSSVLDGRLVDNANHLARLERSLDEIALQCPLSMAELTAVQHELIKRNNLGEGVVYIQVTRGPADRDFRFPDKAQPTLMLFTQSKNILKSPLAEIGVAVVSTPDLRWARRDIKSTSLLAQVLAKQVAHEAGANEAWLVQDGFVTEGASSTAFIVTGESRIVTRKSDTTILPGVTRKAVLALAAEGKLAMEERPFTLEEAHGAAEAFLTSASSFVLPVVQLDGKAIGNGKPGPLTQRLREIYIDFARAG